MRWLQTGPGHALTLAASLVAMLVAAACSSRDGVSDSRTGGTLGTGGGADKGSVGGGGGASLGGGGAGAGRGTGGLFASGGMGGNGGSASLGGLSSGGNGVGPGGTGVSRDAAADGDVGRDASADAGLDAAGDKGDAASFPGTNNPVLSGLFADPAIAVFDGTFYIYPTTDGVADWGATSFSVFSSTNLIKWSNRGVVLDVAKDLKWATGHAWAPSIARVQGTYYYYFTADNQIGVATGQSPLGPFKDPLGKPLVANRQYGVNSIDPHVFIDDDGQAYLSFGNGGLRVAKLDANMISFSGTPTNVTPAGTAGMTIEGSALFKRRGTYYLQWSEGDTRLATYRVAYGLAQSPLGPFTRLATILEQDKDKGILGPGGSTVLAIPARDEYELVYHRFKIPGGDGTHRETCIDRLSFNSDGTIVPVKPTLEGLQTAVSP